MHRDINTYKNTYFSVDLTRRFFTQNRSTNLKRDDGRNGEEKNSYIFGKTVCSESFCKVSKVNFVEADAVSDNSADIIHSVLKASTVACEVRLPKLKTKSCRKFC